MVAVETDLVQTIQPLEKKDDRYDLTCHESLIWDSIVACLSPTTQLPVDSFDYSTQIDSYRPITSPTNIGLVLLSVIAARELGFLKAAEAQKLTDNMCTSLSDLQMRKGLPYAWYDTDTGSPTRIWPDDESSIKPWFSSVDTAWLMAGVYGISQAFPNMDKATQLLEKINLARFYNSSTGLFYGRLEENGQPAEWFYGAPTEARIISDIAVSLGQVPAEHFGALWSSTQALISQLRPDWNRNHRYTVPSWGGSAFEFLMPQLLFNELGSLAPHIWNSSHHDQLLHQVLAGDACSGVWGFSPASTPTTKPGYAEFGVPEMGLWGYQKGLKDATDHLQPVVTPHAVYLSLLVDSPVAIHGLERLLTAYPQLWTADYGLRDSINTESGMVSKRFHSLDQCMAFLALADHLKPDCIRRYFKPLEEKLAPLMTQWKFPMR